MENALIRLEDVHRTYRLGETEVPAVRGVTLELRAGELTALVGPSGSGKSTLLNLAGTIDAPDRGRVLVEGVVVEENVELPLLVHEKLPSAERRARVTRALEDVGLAGYARHPPDSLSGGQRQRVAIARALVTEPILVLADEPTANLDSETARRILDLMVGLNVRRKVTFLFSTHDEKLMARVGRHVHIRDGRLEGGASGAVA